MLKDYIIQMEREFELPDPLDRETDQTWVMPISDERQIQLTALDGDGYYFYARLGACPKVSREDLFQRLMVANLYGMGTLGGLLGMDETGKEITFSRAVPLGTGYEAFKNHLEDFINMVNYWADEVKEFAETA